MNQNQREVIARFESLARKDIMFRGKPAVIKSMVVRCNRIFFSIFTEGKDFDYEKTPEELNLFMRRIIPIVNESIPAVIPQKKVREKEHFNVKVYKFKKRPFYLVFGEDVRSLNIVKQNRHFSIGIPTRQSDIDLGRFILVPSDSKRGSRTWMKRDDLVMGCKSQADYIRYEKYDVAIGKFKSKQCLILTPEL
jgi:hypothetical protein